MAEDTGSILVVEDVRREQLIARRMAERKGLHAKVLSHTKEGEIVSAIIGHEVCGVLTDIFTEQREGLFGHAGVFLKSIAEGLPVVICTDISRRSETEYRLLFDLAHAVHEGHRILERRNENTRRTGILSEPSSEGLRIMTRTWVSERFLFGFVEDKDWEKAVTILATALPEPVIQYP